MEAKWRLKKVWRKFNPSITSVNQINTLLTLTSLWIIMLRTLYFWVAAYALTCSKFTFLCYPSQVRKKKVCTVCGRKRRKNFVLVFNLIAMKHAITRFFNSKNILLLLIFGLRSKMGIFLVLKVTKVQCGLKWDDFNEPTSINLIINVKEVWIKSRFNLIIKTTSRFF